MGAVSDEDDYEPDASEHESRSEVSDDAEAQRTGSEEDEGASPISSRSNASRKRPAQHHLQPYAGAPLKRQRRAFNPGYLSLLNEDIADASVSLIRADAGGNGGGVGDLKPSQIGAVRWSSVEKETFFSALARLGRDDLPGISARLGGSKSVLEVRQYMMLLEDRTQQRRDDGDLRRKTLRPTDVPAAIELSHECNLALEEAADDLALRQENYEIGVEERRWGDRWLVTKDSTTEAVADAGDNMPFLDFFHVRSWLRLSERLFMNSAIPDYNWRYVSEEPPRIRATALSDFHGLVTSITKRLVASTLFMAGMRIKAHKPYMPLTKHLVKARDVKAAVDSLNMKANSQDFWARAPRRLRVDIVQDDDDPDSDREEDDEDDEDREEHVMSYAEVEAALGAPETSKSAEPKDEEMSSEPDEDSEDGSDSPSPENEGESDETELDADAQIDHRIDQEAVRRDIREAMYFSADYEFTTRARQGLQGRVEADHKMEADAEDQDAENSKREEAILWNVLQRGDFPVEKPTTTDEGKQWVRRIAYEPIARNWRDNTQYMSEWETR